MPSLPPNSHTHWCLGLFTWQALLHLILPAPTTVQTLASFTNPSYFPCNVNLNCSLEGHSESFVRICFSNQAFWKQNHVLLNPHTQVLLVCMLPFLTYEYNSFFTDRLVGLVVRRPPREWKVPGSNPTCTGIFSGSSHTSDSKIGTPVATLPGAWHYRVSTGTGQPGVSILWLGEVEHLICNFYLSVAARKTV